jgi:hypothetical protein
MRGSRGVRPAASLVGLVLSLLPRSPHAFHQRCCAPGLRGQGGGSGRGRCEQQPPPSPARSAAPRRRLALWPGQLPPHDPGANFAGWRGLHAATWPRRWGLPAHAATPAGGSGWEEDAEVFDWGPPSKEEIVYEARLAERDDVPTWARAMVLGGKPVQVRSFRGREFPAYLLADAFDLTKANMEEMYLRSIWGWNEAQKRTDLESPMARFFVATDERGRLQGFIHYRFELVDNKFTHESSSAACTCLPMLIPVAVCRPILALVQCASVSRDVLHSRSFLRTEH